MKKLCQILYESIFPMFAKEILADLFGGETDADVSDEEPPTDSPGEDSEGLSIE